MRIKFRTWSLKSVGARGFEPPTSPTRTVRASRAAPRPETDGITPGDGILSQERLYLRY